MFLFFILSIVLGKESYGACINLLEQKIPINSNEIGAKVNYKRMSEYFDGHPPNYIEAKDICLRNKDLFDRVGQYILNQLDLDSQITKKAMTRAISRNIHLFSYVILTMKDDFPNELTDIKINFFRTIGHTPQSSRTIDLFRILIPLFDYFFA